MIAMLSDNCCTPAPPQQAAYVPVHRDAKVHHIAIVNDGSCVREHIEVEEKTHELQPEDRLLVGTLSADRIIPPVPRTISW
jgi:hypothetical protein